MTLPLSARSEKALQLIIDLGERLFVLLLFATLVVRISHSLGLRPYNLLLLISEGIVAFFIIVRRLARYLSIRPVDWIIALAGTGLPMFVRAGGQAVLPSVFGATFMFAGLLLAIWAKLSLRRSLGVVAANRGAVASGPYRFIRHPMYAGYITIYLGYLLNNPLSWNFGVYLMSLVLQVVRVLAEERILRTDPAYNAYAERVRFRFLPAVF
jgi:protein-S-isoprenylcysteine O-methyltransferase Ste14